MKRNRNYVILFAFLLTAITGCRRERVIDINNNLPTGTWRVILFMEDNDNETHHFSGYVFTFNASGTVTATNGSNTILGLWSDGNDNSRSKLVLSFNAGDPFEELNEDWEILEQSATLLRLRHISGGNGDTDLLTLQRI